MNPLLEEVDKRYLEIQSSLEIPLEELGKLTPDEIDDFVHKRDAANPKYKEAYNKFWEVASRLSVDEVIEAYTTCRSKLLRANLSGYMFSNFDRGYVPTMTQAIENDDSNAYLFLNVMSHNLSREEIVPMVLEAFKSKKNRTIEAALASTYKLKISESQAYLKQIIMNRESHLSDFASQVLEGLKNPS